MTIGVQRQNTWSGDQVRGLEDESFLAFGLELWMSEETGKFASFSLFCCILICELNIN